MKKTNKRIIAATMSFILVLVVSLSLLTVGISAEQPQINTSNKNFVACFACKIRAGQGTGYSLLESIAKNSVRTSPSTTSGTYDYEPASANVWMPLRTSSGTNGFVRVDLVSPTDRCYKVTASSGLNLRDGNDTTTSDVIKTLPYGTYVEVRHVSAGMSYVLVRTGGSGYEGLNGYVVNSYLARVA